VFDYSILNKAVINDQGFFVTVINFILGRKLFFFILHFWKLNTKKQTLPVLWHLVL